MAGGAVDPVIVFPAVAEEALQDNPTPLPERKRIPLRKGTTSTGVADEGTVAKGPYAAIDPLYEFPPPLAWVPERVQDAIWHPTVTTKTPWSGMPFAASWYDSAG
jgi:hypothetical protein